MNIDDILRFVENRKNMPHIVSAKSEVLEKMLFALAKEYERLRDSKEDEYGVYIEDLDEGGEYLISRKEASAMIDELREENYQLRKGKQNAND